MGLNLYELVVLFWTLPLYEYNDTVIAKNIQPDILGLTEADESCELQFTF